MRTQGKFEGDLGFPDGHIFLGINDLDFTGTATVTRSGAGLWNLALGNSDTAVLHASLGKLLFRYGSQDWEQEQFGSAIAGGAQGDPVGGFTTLTTTAAQAGVNVNVAVLNSSSFIIGKPVKAGTQTTKIVAIPDATHITLQILTGILASGSVITQGVFTTPAGVTGPAPYPGLTGITPVTSPRPKGIRLREIYPVYAIAGAALTTNTIGITKTVFSPVTAPAVTNILASGANGLATATNAEPYLTPIQIPVSAQTYLTSKYTSYDLEWDVTTAGGGTANIYGIFIDLEFNVA